MPIRISGSTGISGLDGSATTPVLQGASANSGIYYSGNTVFVSTSGTNALTIGPSGNVAFSNTNVSIAGQYISPYSGMMKNRIINGDFKIDQRSNGASNVLSYVITRNPTVDMWLLNLSADANGKMTFTQSNDVPTGQGFTKSLEVKTVGTWTSTSYNGLTTAIEGYNVTDLNWGSNNSPQTVTLSFWIKSSNAATNYISFSNLVDASYITSYTINSPDTWEYKTVTIPGATVGSSWNKTNGIGLWIAFDLGSNTNISTSSGNQWDYNASNFYRVPVGQGGKSTYTGVNTYLRLAGVQLEKGSVATPFEFRHYGMELALCQRYFYKLSGDIAKAYAGSGWIDTSTNCITIITFPVQLRSAPTFTTSGVASDYLIRWGGSNITTCTGVPTSTDSCTLTARIDSPASGMTGGYGGAVRNATVNGHFSFSAEL